MILLRSNMDKQGLPIREITLSGKQLNSIPICERLLFVQIAHLTNNINIQQKLLIWTWQPSDKQIDQQAFVAQQTLMLRHLIGALSEGWEMLQPTYYPAHLQSRFRKWESPEVEVHRKALEKYFKGANILNKIRNRFAFHFDGELIQKELKRVEDTSSLHLYLSPEQGNSLYYLSEEVVGTAMINFAAEIWDMDDPFEIHDRIYKEAIRTANTFLKFGNEIMASIMTEFLSGTEPVEEKRYVLGNLPRVDEIHIPFFVDASKR